MHKSDKMKKIKPKIKILVAYHKKAPLLKNEVLVPIHAGRDIATIPSRNGNVTDKDLEWLITNIIGDNTGDNISYLNRSFNEVTAIYWAWKNYDKLGNPDYIGLMHYRRHLNILDKWKIGCTPKQYINEIGLNYNSLKEIFSEYDLIIPKKTYARKEKYNIDILCQAELKVLERKYPELNAERKKYEKDRMVHFGNIFIMKREYFFSFCEALFDILFASKLYYENTCTKINELAHYGCASEYLTTFYFRWLRNTKNVKTLEVPTIMEEFLQQESFDKKLKTKFEEKKSKVINILSTYNQQYEKMRLLIKLISIL